MNNLFSVSGKIALITGASSGIGKYFANVLAKHGAHVILVGRNEQRLLEVEQECKKYNGKVLSIRADVSSANDIATIVPSCKKQFNYVDILLNVAGIAQRVALLQMTEQQWDDVLNINLKGTFLMSQSIARWMVETGTHGKIINISSSAAFHSTLTRAAYSASKIAVESLTRSLALSLIEHRITVNCIAPGFFVTQLTKDYLNTDVGRTEIAKIPMQRAGDVTDLAGVLLLLTSNASSYMTGSIVQVDGGFAIDKV